LIDDRRINVSRFDTGVRTRARRGCETIEIRVLADNEIGTSFYRTRGYDPVETGATELFGEQVTETLFRGTLE